MKIEYFGHSCFKITTKNGTSVLTDPFTDVGFELPTGVKADFVSVSHEHFDHNYTGGVSCKKVIRGAGDFTAKDFTVKGIKTYHDNEKGKLRGEHTVYFFKADGLTVCHLGDLGESFPCDKPIGSDEVDVLLIPVGGRYTIDSAEAKKYVDYIKPHVVIPMHYKTSDLKIDIAPVDGFVSGTDAQKIGSEAVFDESVKTEDRKIYLMERKAK